MWKPEHSECSTNVNHHHYCHCFEGVGDRKRGKEKKEGRKKSQDNGNREWSMGSKIRQTQIRVPSPTLTDCVLFGASTVTQWTKKNKIHWHPMNSIIPKCPKSGFSHSWDAPLQLSYQVFLCSSSQECGNLSWEGRRKEVCSAAPEAPQEARWMRKVRVRVCRGAGRRGGTKIKGRIERSFCTHVWEENGPTQNMCASMQGKLPTFGVRRGHCGQESHSVQAGGGVIQHLHSGRQPDSICFLKNVQSCRSGNLITNNFPEKFFRSACKDLSRRHFSAALSVPGKKTRNSVNALDNGSVNSDRAQKEILHRLQKEWGDWTHMDAKSHARWLEVLGHTEHHLTYFPQEVGIWKTF